MPTVPDQAPACLQAGLRQCRTVLDMVSCVLAFDIETIPDIETGRRLHDLHSASESEVAEVLFHYRRQQTGGASDFLQHLLHRVIAIAVLLRRGDQVRLYSLGTEETSEPDLLREFFGIIDQYSPTLVSWNGRGFDLPVLHYRTLLHGIRSELYWDTGARRQEFRWNNYQSRFHSRHTDLMDVLAGYDARATAPLNQVARLLNLPGKLGMKGSEVLSAWQRGEITAIRDYCEIDVLLTYLIYLRYQQIRGFHADDDYEHEVDRVCGLLRASKREHLQRFCAQWEECRKRPGRDRTATHGVD